jgi:hypothetical protein
VSGLKVVPYDIPAGCAAGYYPECNPLVPLWHHAVGSQVPPSNPFQLRFARRQVEARDTALFFRQNGAQNLPRGLLNHAAFARIALQQSFGQVDGLFERNVRRQRRHFRIRFDLQ